MYFAPTISSPCPHPFGAQTAGLSLLVDSIREK
jgi:hypothetical protein